MTPIVQSHKLMKYCLVSTFFRYSNKNENPAAFWPRPQISHTLACCGLSGTAICVTPLCVSKICVQDSVSDGRRLNGNTGGCFKKGGHLNCATLEMFGAVRQRHCPVNCRVVVVKPIFLSCRVSFCVLLCLSVFLCACVLSLCRGASLSVCPSVCLSTSWQLFNDT